MQNGGKLSRHIKFCHKNEDRVKNAMALKRKDRDKEFAVFKKEAIVKFNREQAVFDKPNYQREKKANVWKNLICCGFCNAFVGSRGFSRHQKNCQKHSSKKVISLPVDLMAVPNNGFISDDFKANILGKFRNNDIGRLVRRDEVILKIGSVFYSKVKRKLDKASQVRRTVRLEMRRLGNLYNLFLKQDGIIQHHKNSLDMFASGNFDFVREAIEVYSTSETGGIKPGLKQNLYYLLKRSSKALRAIMMSVTELGKLQKLRILFKS